MREPNRWTKISLQVRAIDWTLSRGLIEADCGSEIVHMCIRFYVCASVFMCAYIPRGRGWIAARELTG